METCATCRWWACSQSFSGPGPLPPRTGECRRWSAQFPWRQENQWCGEWEANREHQAREAGQ